MLVASCCWMTKTGSAIQRASDVGEVGGKRAALGLTRGVVGRAQDRGRVDRGGHDWRELGLEQLAALLGHAEARAEDRLRGGGAEEDDRLRLDHAQLLLEPRLARLDLEALRRRVD